MKTKLTFSVLALVAVLVAAEASAEARGYQAHMTTVQKLADTAQVVVRANLVRVEDIELNEKGIDAARYKSIGDGSWQDGEEYIRREAVIRVRSVLKGAATVGEELRFVSIRQLKLAAYDEDLRTGEALYFMHEREDGNMIILSDERGTVSAGESRDDLDVTEDFVETHLARVAMDADGVNEGDIDRMLDAIKLDGSRLSVDCAIELSWHHEDYAPSMNEVQRQRLMSLCKLSPEGSRERYELITCVGRHKPEGALYGLLEVMLNDADWSTTSLASMSLEYVDRRQAIISLLNEWETAEDDTTRMIIVRSLGLIRPKADYDGVELRQATLDIVEGLLNAETDRNLLRESLIASRDLRSKKAHLEELKSLIDNRDSNGLGKAEIRAAIIALAAAREKNEELDEEGLPTYTVYEEEYLKELAESDGYLKQIVDSAITFPYTTLIEGADGKGH